MQAYSAPSKEVCDDLTSGVKEKFPKENDYHQNVQIWCAGEKNLEFWQNISAETFFIQITEPMLYFHGTADDSVPIDWSRRSVKNLKDLNKNAELVEYQDQPHEFIPFTWNDLKKSKKF